MKTFRLIGMALLAIVMGVNLSACSSDDDDNNDSLAGNTWKIVSVDNGEDDFEDWIGSTVTFKAGGTVTFNPDAGWGYAHWTLSDNTLKIVLGERAADDYVEGKLSINGNSAKWDCYWADVDGDWTNKNETHAIMHLQKQ